MFLFIYMYSLLLEQNQQIKPSTKLKKKDDINQ